MSNPFSNEEKLFSVITPIYDITYIHLEQFASAMDAQEYKRFEWIVIFDGPHKKGVQKIKKIMNKYPKMDIQYHTIKHAGCTSARNAGVEHAKGDYYVVTAGDCYLYPEALRIWANTFEEHPDAIRVWGRYDIVNPDGTISHTVKNIPTWPTGEVWYEAFKWSPYCDASFPIKKEAYIPWDPDCKSLNDWEWSVRQLKQNDFTGKGWYHIDHSFFAAEAPKPGGLSYDSHANWKARKHYIMEKNGVEEPDMIVASLGAPHHGFHTTKLLDAGFLPMPSFKEHDYKMVYLLGFYTREDPQLPHVTKMHMDVFERNKGKNVIHWIGTDVLDLHWHCSFQKIKTLKKWFKEKKIIHLCECEWTQKELKEIGIDAKIIPIPPGKLYEPLPLPKEFTVGVYLPNRDIYKHELIMDVVRSMPDVKFLFFGNKELEGQKGDNWEHIGYIDFDEWMPKFSCNLRITLHDGLPLTPIQFMTAGRNVVTNVPLKGAIKVKSDRAEIVAGLRKAQKEPLNANVAQYYLKEMDKDKFKKRIRRLI